jgi:hypothetical protein
VFTVYGVTSYKNNQHFGVVTKQGVKLLSVEYHPKDTPGKNGTQFNLSHTAGTPVAKKGALVLSVDFRKEWTTEIWQPVWQKTLQDVYQPYYIKLIRPVFQYGVAEDGTKTLVSQSNSAFNNGHTWVTINVAEATQSPIRIEIADSSKQNRPIGYSYYVMINGDKLIVSFDDNFISANYGAYVVGNPSDFPGNAPKHPADDQSYEFDMPDTYGDFVYLYFHIDGGIRWYSSADPVFLRYEDAGDVFDENLYIRTDEISDNRLDDRKLKEYTTNEDYDDYVAFLVVTSSNGTEIYRGGITNLNKVCLTGLPAGDYTCELYLNEGDTDPLFTEVLRVIAGVETPYTFGQHIVELDDVITVIHHRYHQDPVYIEDLFLEKEYSDKPPIEIAPRYITP